LDCNEPLLEEGRGLVADAARRGLTLRLLGGMAVRATCPSSRSEPFARSCDDLDFFASASPASIEELFAGRGWLPEAEFNLYNGSSRLKFRHSELGKSADIFLGRFAMCHVIKLDKRLDTTTMTIPFAELLLTKLQVVEANDKDFADCFCILADHGLGPAASGLIDAADFAAACAEDWGLQTTVELSLAKLRAWIGGSNIEEAARSAALDRMDALLAAVSSAPKGLAWKARSMIGRRVRWYELPEEAERC